ncbi:MAG: hypothetical protein KKE59_07140, partial [Proteobacteria bacterium]|nr:hypothetical protein [Pseudomonadota bacterium]
MTQYAVLKDTSALNAVRSILAKMLSQKLVDAMLVAARTPYSALPMPTLITAAERVADADPLAPVAPFNAARQAASITSRPTGKRLALVLRPCEHRAWIELVKLKQCTREDVVIIGIECFGRMENEIYLKHISETSDLTSNFYRNADLQANVSRTCGICELFMPKGADLSISLFGAPEDSVGIIAEGKSGEAL